MELAAQVEKKGSQRGVNGGVGVTGGRESGRMLENDLSGSTYAQPPPESSQEQFQVCRAAQVGVI